MSGLNNFARIFVSICPDAESKRVERDAKIREIYKENLTEAYFIEIKSKNRSPSHEFGAKIHKIDIVFCEIICYNEYANRRGEPDGANTQKKVVES